MSEKKNGVIIGYGHMGGWHVNHYLKSDVVNLAGIYDIDPAKIEKGSTGMQKLGVSISS